MSKVFDPNGVGRVGHLFGLPNAGASAAVELLGVPWEATVSYESGTGSFPNTLMASSRQLDYSLYGVVRPWLLPLRYRVLAGDWKRKSDALRAKVVPYQRDLDEVENRSLCDEVDSASVALNALVASKTKAVLAKNKIPILVGGEHSIALGGISAVCAQMPTLGVLHIDAHMDLRPSYQGFTYSHASTMARVLNETSVSRIVQVGIRDYAPVEAKCALDTERILVFYDDAMRMRLLQGKSFATIADEIIATLPAHVYVSVDIDGLSGALQPHTGTPVAGGLSFSEWDYLLRALVDSGRRIVGADLCECSPAQNAAEYDLCLRLLYRLTLYAACSQGVLDVKKPLTTP